jgi:hypothetical protein
VVDAVRPAGVRPWCGSPPSYTNYPQLLAYAQAHYGPAATPKDTSYGSGAITVNTA